MTNSLLLLFINYFYLFFLWLLFTTVTSSESSIQSKAGSKSLRAWHTRGIAFISAAMAGAMMQVTPQRVKEQIASSKKRTKCSRWVDHTKKDKFLRKSHSSSRFLVFLHALIITNHVVVPPLGYRLALCVTRGTFQMEVQEQYAKNARLINLLVAGVQLQVVIVRC